MVWLNNAVIIKYSGTYVFLRYTECPPLVVRAVTLRLFLAVVWRCYCIAGELIKPDMVGHVAMRSSLGLRGVNYEGRINATDLFYEAYRLV